MKRPWKRRVFSVLLILTGIGGLFYVFWLLPYLALSSSGIWQGMYGTHAYWEHTEDRIRRFGWTHDDFGPVGDYGGKEWAEWIIKRIPSETDPDDCSAGHKISALKRITNHSPGGTREPWEKQLPLWIDWWEQNRGKTQEEWIVDGFAAAGVTIHNPPTKEDWPVLLAVLAPKDPRAPESKRDFESRRQEHLFYNAFRCLRDSGFNPVAWALEGGHTPEVKAGLLAYQREAQGTMPGQTGRLFNAKDSDYRLFGYMPNALTPGFRYTWGSACVAALVLGLWLWRKGSANSVSGVSAQPPGQRRDTA